jgi:putative transposase
MKQSINAIKTASRQHSQKRKESANRETARKNLVRKHEDVANRRCNWFWKMAHELTDKFDVLCFETLNIKGMQRLWARKISDLAFGEFLQILQWIATKKGKQVVFLWRWYPSSKTCSDCGHVLESLDISVREWRFPSCQSINGQDENAALNIEAVGASTVRLGDVCDSFGVNHGESP